MKKLLQANQIQILRTMRFRRSLQQYKHLSVAKDNSDLTNHILKVLI